MLLPQSKPVAPLFQESASQLRNILQNRLNDEDFSRWIVGFDERGALPAAAIIEIQGLQLRLEKDLFDGRWTIATNEEIPRLIERLDDADIGNDFETKLKRVAEMAAF